jgi:hypothetical protein
MNRPLSRLLPAVVTLVLSFALPAAAQPREAGDLWEVTNEMSMPGMPAGMQMPQRPPQRVCRARNSDKPPVADNDNRCESYDVKRTPTSYAWKMRCENNTTGTGEITYEGRDSYKGTINMNVGGQSMTMKMTGKRVGDCDGGEQKRQIAAVQQQVAAAQQQQQDAFAQMCKCGVDSMTAQPLRPETGYKCDAKYKVDLCKRLQTQEGFAIVAPRKPSAIAGLASGDLKEAADFCGVNGDQIRVSLCKRADEQEAVDFLASSCLGYARKDGAASSTPADTFGSVIIARECAGRNFSSPPAERYRGFCSAAARNKLMQPVTADASKATGTPSAAGTATTEEKKDDAATRGKKLLKDIFSR